MMTAARMSIWSQIRAAARAPTTTPRLVRAVMVPKMRPRRPSSVSAASSANQEASKPVSPPPPAIAVT